MKPRFSIGKNLLRSFFVSTKEIPRGLPHSRLEILCGTEALEQIGWCFTAQVQHKLEIHLSPMCQLEPVDNQTN